MTTENTTPSTVNTKRMAPAHAGELANRLKAIFDAAGPLDDPWTSVARALWAQEPQVTVRRTPDFGSGDFDGRYGSDDWFAVHEDVWGKRMETAFIGADFDERVVCEGLTHEDADTIVHAVNAARIARSNS